MFASWGPAIQGLGWLIRSTSPPGIWESESLLRDAVLQFCAFMAHTLWKFIEEVVISEIELVRGKKLKYFTYID